MTTPAQPDAGVTLTLAGPTVTAMVSWERVRAYLTREGWVSLRHSEWVTTWRPADQMGRFTPVINERKEATPEEAIVKLARLASVSPGEMLQRIAVAT